MDPLNEIRLVPLEEDSLEGAKVFRITGKVPLDQLAGCLSQVEAQALAQGAVALVTECDQNQEGFCQVFENHGYRYVGESEEGLISLEKTLIKPKDVL